MLASFAATLLLCAAFSAPRAPRPTGRARPAVACSDAPRFGAAPRGFGGGPRGFGSALDAVDGWVAEMDAEDDASGAVLPTELRAKRNTVLLKWATFLQSAGSLGEAPSPPVATLTNVSVELRGETVVRNARAYLLQEIPELIDVVLADPDDELDQVTDPETGLVVEDRRSPDYNGDRETLTYQGIDPDTRGPFPSGTGGLRPGGSMFS